MKNKLRKDLMVDINEFLCKLEWYTVENDELQMTKLIVQNELARYFKNLEKYCK